MRWQSDGFCRMRNFICQRPNGQKRHTSLVDIFGEVVNFLQVDFLGNYPGSKRVFFYLHETQSVSSPIYDGARRDACNRIIFSDCEACMDKVITFSVKHTNIVEDLRQIVSFAIRP